MSADEAAVERVALREALQAIVDALDAGANMEYGDYIVQVKAAETLARAALAAPAPGDAPLVDERDAPLSAARLRELLEERDAFIVANGLWEKFVAELSRRAQGAGA